jgi:cyclic pyranopterin phosphate synthase
MQSAESHSTGQRRGSRSSPAALMGLSAVELEVGSRCNRACSYCPVSLNPRPPVPARMSDEVFLASVQQLAAASFAGRISYHLYNEPLLRRDLARLVTVVDELLPDALQVLNTNGDLLDGPRYADLRQSGVDYFYVTRHEQGPYPDRPFQIVQDSAALTLTNRGGTMVHLPSPSAAAGRTPCWAPSEMLIVTVTGDVLLCYEDAHRENVLGNVLASSLPEIWNDEGTAALRRRLQSGDRAAASLCTACSNVSHAEPGLSALEDPVLAAARLVRGAEAVSTLKSRSRAARNQRGRAPDAGPIERQVTGADA